MILIKIYIAEAVDLYKEEGFSKKVAEWNQLRKQAVELALKVLIDWLVDWLIDWLIKWLSDWMSDWLIDWLIDWFSSGNAAAPASKGTDQQDEVWGHRRSVNKSRAPS